MPKKNHMHRAVIRREQCFRQTPWLLSARLTLLHPAYPDLQLSYRVGDNLRVPGELDRRQRFAAVIPQNIPGFLQGKKKKRQRNKNSFPPLMSRLLPCLLKNDWRGGTSLVVQWLRLHAPNAGGMGSIPGQGTRSHMLPLRVHMPQLKILHATTKTRYRQINKYFSKRKKEWVKRRGQLSSLLPVVGFREQVKWRLSPACLLGHQSFHHLCGSSHSLQHVLWVSCQVATRMKCSSPGRCSDRQLQAMGTKLEVTAVCWSSQNWSLNRKCGNPVELFTQQKQTRLQIQISPLLTPDPPTKLGYQDTTGARAVCIWRRCVFETSSTDSCHSACRPWRQKDKGIKKKKKESPRKIQLPHPSFAFQQFLTSPREREIKLPNIYNRIRVKS